LVFLPLIPLAALVVAWLCGALDRFDSPAKVADLLGALRGEPLALGYVLAGFVVGALSFVPITALIAGTLLAFKASPGFWYALLGVQLAAAATYWFGRALGAHSLQYLSGPRITKLKRQLTEHAVRASASARVLPVGNFTLINWLIGGMRVPFHRFMLGNLLGSLPGLLVFAVFAERLGSALRDPQPGQLAVALGVGVGALLLGYLAEKLAKRVMR
jgi:uncharacterized membrane protein YdjX (TVP38/TMEM64 family)